MEELSAALRRERELLDRLRFRFVETRLLLSAHETRYLASATREVVQALVRAREADLLRAAALQRLQTESGIGQGDETTLRELAASAAEPWAGILRDHHEQLCTVVSEIEVIGYRIADLARVGIGHLAERSGPSIFEGWLGTLNGDSTGAIVLDEIAAAAEQDDHLADEQAYQDAITTASRLRMPALLAFLR